MSLTEKQPGTINRTEKQNVKIEKWIRRHTKTIDKERFWTYIRSITISTSHKTYHYYGSTDNRYTRTRLNKNTPHSDIANLTRVDQFIKKNRVIILFDKTEYRPFYYNNDCVEKSDRRIIRLGKEQLLLDQWRLEATTDSSIIILNKNNPIALKKTPSTYIWNNKTYICPCGFLTKGSDFTCSRRNKSQHCRQNYTHKQWVKNTPVS